MQCQSLISWVNDGSHYAPDELFVAIGDGMAASYMRIFFKIFKAANHDAHYRMMMGEDYVDLDPDEPADELPASSEEDDEDLIGSADAVTAKPILVPGLATIQGGGLAQVEGTAPSVAPAGVSHPEADPDIPF